MVTIESLANIRPSDVHPPLTNDYRMIKNARERWNGEFSLSVSVVIPFYRNLQILTRSLASLIDQTYPSRLTEIVVCNDGSDEPVHSIIKEFSPVLNLRYVDQERQGHRVSTARNRGIVQANGEVIISLDFDMICPPDFIATHLTWFHISDKVATIGPRKFIDASQLSVNDIISNFEVVTQLPPVKSVSNRMKVKDERIGMLEELHNDPFPSNWFYGCNVAYRRRQALEIGGFDEGYNGNPNYEDIDFGHRLWLSGVFLVGEPEALAYHQENSVVTLRQRIKEATLNRKRLYNKFPELMEYRHSIGKP